MNDEKKYHYRVYYNENGSVITYAMTDVEGLTKWIEITREQFAEANPFCKVIEGELKKPVNAVTYIRLVKTDIKDPEGQFTSKDDMCIILDSIDDIEYTKYKINQYEKISGYS